MVMAPGGNLGRDLGGGPPLPTIAPAGSNVTAALAQGKYDDHMGTITWQCSGTPAANGQVTVTFGTPKGAIPRAVFLSVMLTAGLTQPTFGLFAQAVSTTFFVIAASGVPAVNGIYAASYWIID